MNVSQMFLERIGIIPGLFWMTIERKRVLNQNFCKILHRVRRDLPNAGREIKLTNLKTRPSNGSLKNSHESELKNDNKGEQNLHCLILLPHFCNL